MFDDVQNGQYLQSSCHGPYITLKIVLKLQIQAPKEANFYESQRIALKLIHMPSLVKKVMLY